MKITTSDEGSRSGLRSDARTINREYYGRLSTGRDDYWRKMAAPRFRAATFLDLLDGERAASLVDLGCGNGLLLSEIEARYPDMALAGLDLSEAQIAANKAVHPAVGWHAMDLEQPDALPSGLAGRFEAVVASEIVEHVKDPRTFLANALQLAVPGRGRLLLSTQSGPLRETERRVGHLQHFTAPAMRRLLTEAGWEPVRVWNAGFPFHDLSKWYANRNPDSSMRRFGDERYGWREDLVCAALRAAFRLNSDRRGAQLFAVARRVPDTGRL
jgi:2-polyprenyl-3-methyl-5-hydroxy-6-metoxy-1,4-benzoquinol methylase